MSGPKVSIYRLEPYIRENVLTQQRLKRKCLILSRSVNELISDLEPLAEQCRFLIQERQKMCEYIGASETEEKELKACIDEIETKKKALADALHACGKIEPIPTKYHYSPAIVETDTEKARRLDSVKNESKSTLEYLRKKTTGIMNRNQVNHEAVKLKAAKSIGTQVHFDFETIAVKTEKHDWRKRDQEVKKLKEIIADADLSEEIKKRAQNAIEYLLSADNEHIIENYLIVYVSGIHKDAERERNRKKEEYSEYSIRIDEYHAICKAFQRNPNEIDFNDNWRDELQTAIAELEAYSDKENQKSYITEALDKIMAEMGYHVIGCRDEQKKSGRTFHSSLYSFADGRAINITQSDDGQITMEVCGLDHNDRIPEDREAKMLEEDMYSFCTQFSEIERRLKERGVVMESRISMAPPSEEYATIINLDDFILAQEHIETINSEMEIEKSNEKGMYHS